MKTLTKGIVTALGLICAVTTAHAHVVDLRVGAGLDTGSPGAFNDRVKTINGSSLDSKTFDSYNADVIFHLPVLPITLGVRYETANQKRTGSNAGTNTEWKLNVNNLAVLADLRIINTSFLYVGPLVSVGYPWGSLKFVNGSSSSDNNLNNSRLSYSGGLEAGVYLGPLLVGAEAGYKSVRFKGAGSSASNSANARVNLDGFYGKALVGVAF